MDSSGGTLISEPSKLDLRTEWVRGEVARCYGAFFHCNKQRLGIMKQLLSQDRYELLQMIPLLFHVNNLRAPGFVADLGNNTGVHGFRLNDDVRAQRKALMNNFQQLSVGVIDRPMVISIASIGSAGTLSQTEHSDFDLWIVCRDDISNVQYRMMAEKAALIKKWLLEQDPGLDLNFYMATPSDVKRHYFGEVSDDGAGTALGKLLKEEFYRTCLVWMGQIPLWWALPYDVKTPEDYEQWREAVALTNLPIKEDLMDLGPLERSTLPQFLAAVMWQANKSLGSPFKSLLKLSVVNRYADEPDAEFIAERIRMNVQMSPTHGRNTDPYTNLFDYCASYWHKQGLVDGALLMSEMFFLKVMGDRMSGAQSDWDQAIFKRRTEIRDLLKSWGLTPDIQRKLSSIARWEFHEAMRYQERTQSFIHMIFDRVMVRLDNLGIAFEGGKVKKLREDTDEEAVSILSQFANISQKVECYYGTHSAHVNPISPSFRRMLHKQAFALVFNPEVEHDCPWVLVEEIPVFLEQQQAIGLVQTGVNGSENGAATPEASTKSSGPEDGYTPGDRSEHVIMHRSALGVITWMAANRLMRSRTVLRVMAAGQRRPPVEFRNVANHLNRIFDHPLYYDALPEKAFSQKPRHVSAFVSFDMELHSQFRPREDKSEGRMSDNAAEDMKRLSFIDIAEQTSYGTVRVYQVDATRYKPVHLLGRLVQNYGHMPIQELRDKVVLHSADTLFHGRLQSEFQTLFYKCHKFFGSRASLPDEALRLITRLGTNYAVLTRLPNGKFQASECSDINSLIALLERPVGLPCQTIVDPDIEGPERLREIFARWERGVVQIFVKRGSGLASIHVLDEAGTFYNLRVPADQVDTEVLAIQDTLRALDIRRMRYVRPLAGSLDMRTLDIINIAGDAGTLFKYRTQQTKPSRSAQQAASDGVLFLRLNLMPDDDEGPRMELRMGNQVARQPLAPRNALQDAAQQIRATIDHYRLRDFRLLNSGSPIKRPTDIGQILSQRRALDKALRAMLASIPATQAVS